MARLGGQGLLVGWHAAHLLSIDGYRLDLPLSSGQWLGTCHDDRPSIRGAVGQLLGDATINIGFMPLGRDELRGMALMVVGGDALVPDDVVRVAALPPIASARRDAVSGLRGRATPRGARHRPAQGQRAACDRHPGGERRRWCGSHAPEPGATRPLPGDRDGRAGAARCDRRALQARYRRTRYTRAPSSAPVVRIHPISPVRHSAGHHGTVHHLLSYPARSLYAYG